MHWLSYFGGYYTDLSLLIHSESATVTVSHANISFSSRPLPLTILIVSETLSSISQSIMTWVFESWVGVRRATFSGAF